LASIVDRQAVEPDHGPLSQDSRGLCGHTVVDDVAESAVVVECGQSINLLSGVGIEKNG